MSETERDELASVIVAAYGEDPDSECPCEQDLDVADAILAAGYRRPRTVTTVEEMQALPMGSVIRLNDRGYVYARHYNDSVFPEDDWVSPLHHVFDEDWLPATVLHEPEAAE